MANISDVHNLQRKLEGSLNQKMAEFEERLKVATSTATPTLIQLQAEFCTFKEIISSMISLLQEQINDCTSSIDAINMRSRRKALIFNGISEASGEVLEQKILTLLRDTMGLSDMNISSIKKCFRLGVTQGSKPRAVLAYFSNHVIKQMIWKKKSILKGSGCVVSEFLTKIRQTIHKEARKHFGMTNVWTLDGVIYVKHPDGRAKIVSKVEWDALVLKYPAQALSNSGKPVESGKAVHTSSLGGQAVKPRSIQSSSAFREDDSRRSRRQAARK